MNNVETARKTHHVKWLFLPAIAVIFIVSAFVYVSIPANMKPVNNINNCIDAGYVNRALPTGGWQCTTPDGHIFVE